ncbi:MAG: sodium-dependent transporter [Bacteroidales bacterium]|nr:sodium-dependent transporter [Bacteroidales bacterium]
MTKFDFSKRDGFGSKFGVVAAAAGSAIGLGNIWRFPYVVGENGGGAFLLIYLFFVISIGIPVMLSEFVIGRSAQRNPVGAFKKLAPGKSWYLVGLMGVGAAFMILAFYTVVAGWTLEYLYQSIINGFHGKTPDNIANMFDNFRGSFRPIIWFLIFMVLTAGIVMAGIKNGIEKFTKVLMPVLFLILIIISIRSLTLPGAGKGLEFLFKPDFSKITPKVILEALGQAFFSLSIGMGTLITYGSYISKKQNLTSTAFSVTMADTIIAVIAGIAIFPAVFAFGIPPASEEGLVFITLPVIFEQMPGGYFFSLLFFVLLSVAALTSTISVLEVIVAYMSEELNITRKQATILGTVSVAVLGAFASNSSMVFKVLNYTSATILLPLGGLLIVLFIGWFYNRGKVETELTNDGKLNSWFFKPFILLVKYLAPIAIAAVFLYGLGIF